MTSTKLHQKSVKSGLRLPCFNRRTGGSGHARGGSCRRPHHRQESFCRRPHHRQECFAAPQARGFLPHHRQGAFYRTTGKKVFAAPQARGLLPHIRRDGYNGQTIFLLLQIRVFFLLTGSKCEDQRYINALYVCAVPWRVSVP